MVAVPVHPELCENFMCSICLEVVQEPRLTQPCEHLFCRSCLDQTTASGACPVCRTPTRLPHIQWKRGSFIYRQWAGIKVKCGVENCSWTGSVVHYKKHPCEDGCSSALVRELTTKVQALMLENYDLKTHRIMYESRSDEALTEAQRKIERLESKVQKLQADSRHKLPKLFTGNYNFNRHSVIQLSQLISRYLENKPAPIDSNKIYNCVHIIHKDLKVGYNDNPEHLQMDTIMLLATCWASTWFTQNQRNNIHHWLRNLT